MEDETVVAGRTVPRVYRISGRQDLHRYIAFSIERSGGKVLYASVPTRAPFFFGVQTDRGESLGLLIYPFRVVRKVTNNRPEDEVRGQLRLGGEDVWDADNPIGFDIAGVDTTLMLGIDPDQSLFLGLDPRLWDPMPLGISFFAKDSDVARLGEHGWHVWEKADHSGTKRERARSETGSEVMVAFRPDRFLDFARFERQATDLGLDTPLRLRAANRYGKPQSLDAQFRPSHVLEEQFDLSSREILEIIAGRSRLAVAVRGGVAEHHLELQLNSDKKNIRSVQRRDRDGEPDFDVELKSGPTLVVECKNASPQQYANGDFRVEVQKTRASKGDPASRYYKLTEFDVVAACLWAATGEWQFRFARTSDLRRHEEYPDRLAAMQHVDGNWTKNIFDL